MCSVEFDSLLAASRAMDEKSTCSIISTCLACGYEDDFEGMWKLFKKYGRRQRCKTNFHTTLKVWEHLGFFATNVTDEWKAKTVRGLFSEWKENRPIESYIVNVSGHMFCMDRNQFHESVSNKRIKHIWRMDEVGRTFIKALGNSRTDYCDPFNPKGRDVTLEYIKIGGKLSDMRRVCISTDEKNEPILVVYRGRKVPLSN